MIRTLARTAAVVAVTVAVAVPGIASASTADRAAYVAHTLPVATSVYPTQGIRPAELLAAGDLACEVGSVATGRTELLGGWYSSHRLVNAIVRDAHRYLCPTR